MLIAMTSLRQQHEPLSFENCSLHFSLKMDSCDSVLTSLIKINKRLAMHTVRDGMLASSPPALRWIL